MDQDDRWLNDLADAILDGTPDPHLADAPEVSDSHRAAIRQAKILARIGELHRSQPADPDSRRLTFESDAAGHLPSWGRLTIIEEIGRGAFGEVYRANDPLLDRDVALKLLRLGIGVDGDQIAASVIEEGRRLARVHHPNVVTIHDADQIGGRVGLTMELVRGRTLEQELQQGGPFSATEVIAVGIEVSRALSAVHEAGLLHRDIKAQNVMRQDAGRKGDRLVLMDFGAGRELFEAQSQVTMDLAGTPLYLAPEVFEQRPASTSSDIYSVGVLLYHLATGSFPVQGQTLDELRGLHARGERSQLAAAGPALPQALVRIVERAIDPDPSRRYQSAAALERALQGIARPQPRRHRRAAAVTALVACAGLAGAIGAVAFRWFAPPAGVSARLGFQPQDAVLIARFDNRTGEPVFDGAVEYALERELSSSEVIGIVSRERVDDALRLMKRPPDTVIDRTIGREVSLRDGHVKALLAGRIEKFGANYVLTAQLVDPADDRVVSTLSEEATGQQAILTALHRQASRVRIALGENRDRIKGADPRVEPGATQSLHAFQLYNQAYQLGRQGKWSAALEVARHVVVEDPQFGSAWIWLAWSTRNASVVGASAFAFDDPRLPTVREVYRPFAERGLRLADAAPEWERAWITASYYTLMGDDVRAVPVYEALLRLRPDHYYAANNLLAAVRRLNRPDEMVAAQTLLANQRPNDFLENAHAATMIVERPQGEEAAKPYVDRMRAWLQSAGSQVPPQWDAFLQFLPAYGAWWAGDVKGSLERIDQIARSTDLTSPRRRPAVGLPVVFWYLTLGRAADAARVAASLDAQTTNDRRLSALVADVRGDRLALRQQLIGDPIEAAPMYVRAELLDEARARVTRPVPANAPLQNAWNDLARGDLLLVEGRPEEAVTQLQAGLRTLKFLDDREYDRGCESLATALTRLARRPEAVAALEECATNRVRASNPVQSYRFDAMRVRLRLADEYRALGRVAEAMQIEQGLERRLAYADQDFPLVQQLKKRP